MLSWRTVFFLFLVAGFFQGGAVFAQAAGVVDRGSFTYRSKTFEKGRKIAQVSGTFSLLEIDGTLIYSLEDRNTSVGAYIYPDGRYMMKIINKKTEKRDRRTGAWRYQNPFTIVTNARNHRGHAVYKDRLGVPPPGARGISLTLNLRKNVHQKIAAKLAAE